MGHRTAQETEVDGLGPREADRLDRGRDQALSDRRAVGGQHHVAPTLQHLDLVGHRPRRAPEIGRRDHIEHCLAWRGDIDGDGAEGS